MSGNRNRPASGRAFITYEMNTMNYPNGNGNYDDGYYTPSVHINGNNNTVFLGAHDAMWQQEGGQAFGAPVGGAAPYGTGPGGSRPRVGFADDFARGGALRGGGGAAPYGTGPGGSRPRVLFADDFARGGALAGHNHGVGHNHGYNHGYNHQGGGHNHGHNQGDGRNHGHNHGDGHNGRDGHDYSIPLGRGGVPDGLACVVNLTQRYPPPVPPPPTMSRTGAHGTGLLPATNHFNSRMVFYNIDLDPIGHPQRCLVLLDNHCPILASRLVECFHWALTNPKGILQRYVHLKDMADFNHVSNQLAQRARREINAAAAIVCYQYARGPGEKSTNSMHDLNSWMVEDRLCYERCCVMGSLLVTHYNISCPRIDQLTLEDIMGFDLNRFIRDTTGRMSKRGIVSEHAAGIGNGNDILDAVYLPTFLFFDTVMKDNHWRSFCQVRHLWVGTQRPHNEVSDVDSNLRLHNTEFY